MAFGNSLDMFPVFTPHPTMGAQGRQDVSRLTQTARVRSRGLLGLLSWYAVTPCHGIVFQGMLHGIRASPRTPHGPASVTGYGSLLDLSASPCVDDRSA